MPLACGNYIVLGVLVVVICYPYVQAACIFGDIDCYFPVLLICAACALNGIVQQICKYGAEAVFAYIGIMLYACGIYLY